MGARERQIRLEAEKYTDIMYGEYLMGEHSGEITYNDVENAYQAAARSEREYILDDIAELVKAQKSEASLTHLTNFDNGFLYGLEYILGHLEKLLKD